MHRCQAAASGVASLFCLFVCFLVVRTFDQHHVVHLRSDSLPASRADPDLTRSPRHGKGDDGITSDAGQTQAERSECIEERRWSVRMVCQSSVPRIRSVRWIMYFARQWPGRETSDQGPSPIAHLAPVSRQLAGVVSSGSDYQLTRKPVVHDTPEYAPPSPARSFMSACCSPVCSLSLWP